VKILKRSRQDRYNKKACARCGHGIACPTKNGLKLVEECLIGLGYEESHSQEISELGRKHLPIHWKTMLSKKRSEPRAIIVKPAV
jgi:hypothetical protein